MGAGAADRWDRGEGSPFPLEATWNNDKRHRESCRGEVRDYDLAAPNGEVVWTRSLACR